MRKYSTPLPEPSRTFDVNPRASRQARLDVLLSNRTTWNSSMSTIQGKESMATHMSLQKAPLNQD